MTKTNFRNISQVTYDRIVDAVRTPRGDAWRPRITGQDARDLLEAYEAAVTLLSYKVDPSNTADDAHAFLYLPGTPRVERVLLDTDEELSHSARGELRPADSDDYEP